MTTIKLMMRYITFLGTKLKIQYGLYANSTSRWGLTTFQVSVATGGKWQLKCPEQI